MPLRPGGRTRLDPGTGSLGSRRDPPRTPARKPAAVSELRAQPLLAPVAREGYLDVPGEMAALVAATDWSASPLGDPQTWPQSLRTAVGICLSSRFPILLWWGPDLVMIYNDAYRPMLGETKHPRALGAPGREVWTEIWDVIGPMLEQVMAGGGATWSADELLRARPQRLPRGVLLHVLLQPDHRRVRRGRGRLLRGHRDDRAGRRRAAAGDPGRDGRP